MSIFPVRTCKDCGWKTTSTSTIDHCLKCGTEGLRPKHFLTRDKPEPPFTSETTAALDALPSLMLRPCPKCGLLPEKVSFSLSTGVCQPCSPCPVTALGNPPKPCMWNEGHRGPCDFRIETAKGGGT